MSDVLGLSGRPRLRRLFAAHPGATLLDGEGLAAAGLAAAGPARQGGRASSQPRMHFIDVLRAVAILWMLADHFVAVLLSKQYRNVEEPFYASWAYLRGFTAPLFFTVAGFVFACVLRVERPVTGNPQVASALKRVAQLWIVGYGLQLSLLGLWRGHLSEWLLAVHVLQSMALGLLLLVAGYALHSIQRRVPLSLLYAALGLTIFFTTPGVRAAEYGHWPLWAANYFTSVHGSVFPLFPWAGFVLLGGGLGVSVAWLRNHGPLWLLGAWVLGLGALLLSCARPLILGLAAQTDTLAYLASAWQPRHYLIRFGEVCCLLGALMMVEHQLCARMPLWFRRVGQRTLTIYIAHTVLLYGSVSGVGLDSFFSAQFSPQQVLLIWPCFVVPLVLLAQRPMLRSRRAAVAT